MLGAPYTEKAKLAVFTAFSTSNTASLSKSESLEGDFSCSGDDAMARRACGGGCCCCKRRKATGSASESCKQSCRRGGEEKGSDLGGWREGPG